MFLMVFSVKVLHILNFTFNSFSKFIFSYTSFIGLIPRYLIFLMEICFDEVKSRGRKEKLLLGLLPHIIKEFSHICQV